MNLLHSTRQVLAGTARAMSGVLTSLSGGVAVRTDDVPLQPGFRQNIGLDDIRRCELYSTLGSDEPRMLAVVVQRHGALKKVSFVVLDHRTRRVKDADGCLQATALLCQAVDAELQALLGGRSCVLLAPSAVCRRLR